MSRLFSQLILILTETVTKKDHLRKKMFQNASLFIKAIIGGIIIPPEQNDGGS